MMMWYLGTGIGHRQSADFPREDSLLPETLSGDFYVRDVSGNGEDQEQTAEEETENLVNAPTHRGNGESDSDSEEFDEQEFEL